MYQKFIIRYLLISLFSASLLSAQSVEFIFVEYTEDWIQESQEQLDPFPYDPPYRFMAVFEVEDGDFSSLSFSLGDTVTEIPEGYEYQAEFETLEAMTTAWPAGTYTFAGEGSEVGAFSFEVEVDAFTPLTPKLVTNYLELQAVDPDADISLEWEAFSDYADEGLIMVTASYPMADGSYVREFWESEHTRDDGWPGLPADTVSVLIPAGTLTGSDVGRYDITVEFLSLSIKENNSPFEEAQVMVLSRSSTFVQLVVGEASATPTPEEPTPTPTPTEPVGDLYLQMWEVGPNHWTDTESWLGYLWVGSRPWAFSIGLNGFIFVDEDGFDPDQGGWFYVPQQQ